MTTQTYCTKADIEEIWPAAELLASVDDDASGTLSPAEEAHITRAIERAANVINARLEVHYRLTELEGNAWCRDANAAIAAYWLATRQGEAAPAHLTQQYDAYISALSEIAAGRMTVPQIVETFDVTPGVTNFEIRLDEPHRKARRVEETSR
jgi:phage gp36-like protein